MKKLNILLMFLFIPLIMVAHIKDERLFSSEGVLPSAMILLDRSGSMGWGTDGSTRIKDAILVIHSLLDANNDGFVTNNDEDSLPIELGQGFHREGKHPDVYLPNDYYYDSDLGEFYNENTGEWEDAYGGNMYTDYIGSHFEDIWNHMNYTDLEGYVHLNWFYIDGGVKTHCWQNKNSCI